MTGSYTPLYMLTCQTTKLLVFKLHVFLFKVVSRVSYTFLKGHVNIGSVSLFIGNSQ